MLEGLDYTYFLSTVTSGGEAHETPKMTVINIRAQLRKLQLPTDGTKSVLLQRLAAAKSAAPPAALLVPGGSAKRKSHRVVPGTLGLNNVATAKVYCLFCIGAGAGMQFLASQRLRTSFQRIFQRHVIERACSWKDKCEL